MDEVAEVARPRWAGMEALRPWGPLVGIAALLALLYLRPLAWLVNAWLTDPFYSHGVLVPALVLGRVYWQWPRVRELPRSQEGWGLAPVALGLGLLAYGRLRDDLFIQGCSLLVLVAGLVLATQGFARTRRLAAPLAVLAFALPYPFLAYVGPQLQAWSAEGATFLLGAAGVAVQQDAFTITASGVRFEVAPLCSGLSSLISLTFVAFVAGYLGRVPTLWHGGLTLAAVPLAVGSNLVRVASTVFVGITVGPEQATQYFEGASNLVLYSVALAPILACIWWLRRRPFHA